MKIITCSNGYACQVSHEKINKESVIKIDFNITSYQALIPGRSWITIQYPTEVLPSINDKIYITKKQLYDIVELLDTFIETGDIMTPTTGFTNRGFALNEMKDFYGNVISIQKSSSIDTKLWFGTRINEDNIGVKLPGHEDITIYKYPENQRGISVHDRLHLNLEQASELRMSILREIVTILSHHDVADLVDRNTQTANNMIMDIWGDLHANVQKTIFMYGCGKGNLALVKKIYKHPENKFMHDIFCTLEEFGLQMSLEPESKKILKFFKIMMKEQDMELSSTMQRWVRENKLGRKIRLKN